MSVSNSILRNTLLKFRVKVASNLDFDDCLALHDTNDWSTKEELGNFDKGDWIFLKWQVISVNESNEKGRYAYVITYGCDDRPVGLGSGEEPLYANMWIYESGEIEYWDVDDFNEA